MTARAKTYLLLRGGGAFLFVFAATALPRGVPAALVAVTGGLVAMLTCLGVNAGGPGESAGAQAQRLKLEKVRPPQGDWPPYEDDMVLDGEVLDSRVTPPDEPAA